MKPPPFDYHRPDQHEEVDALLEEFGGDAKILAGGQSLIPLLNMRLSAPAHIIDINGLADETAAPATRNAWVSCGPLVRQVAVERSQETGRLVPLLAEALTHVAHPAIRTRGTIAGSIAHADPAAELPAAFMLLGGEVVARGSGGRRAVSAQEFFAGPLENSLAANEWVAEVRWPVSDPKSGFAFEEFARRSGDYALCGVAARAAPAPEGCVVTLSYLGMGSVPVALETSVLSEEEMEGDRLYDAVGELVSSKLEPVDDIHATAAYRAHLGRHLGGRAARTAWSRAKRARGGD